MKNRGRDGDPKTWKEFREQDRRDLRGHLDGTGQDTENCMEMAKWTINNNFTLGSLRKKADRVYDDLFCPL